MTCTLVGQQSFLYFLHIEHEPLEFLFYKPHLVTWFHTFFVRIERHVHQDGKPVSREGISHMFKYIRLESYEDALANIELQRTDPQQLLLHKAGGFRESYMLKYMLDVESRGSQALLNIDNFDDPGTTSCSWVRVRSAKQSP